MARPLQAPRDAPSPPRLQPPGRGQLLGRGTPGGPSCRLASPRRGDLGAGLVPGRPENGGAPRLLSAAHPARPPTRSLTPRMHTPGRRRCCAPAGGRAERRARTKAARSRARRHARAHAGHTRARPEYTCAHTPTHAHRHAQPLCSLSARCPPPRNRWARRGPWHLTASVAIPFPSWGDLRRKGQSQILIWALQRPFFLAWLEQFDIPQTLPLCNGFSTTPM